MTESELRKWSERVRREAWAIALLGLVTNLGILTANLVWWNRWWVPMNLVGLAIITHGIRRLIVLEHGAEPTEEAAQ